MASILITKQEGARRQLDAAIRMMFSGEDPLAVHTIAAAAHRVLVDLAKHRGLDILQEDSKAGLEAIYRNLIGREPTEADFSRDLPIAERMIIKHRNRPTNFLKHADIDADKSLDPIRLETDHLILQACAIYDRLGLIVTPEMRAFMRWHLAVYPHEEGDPLITASGPLDKLSREEQLDAGDYLLEIYRRPES